MVGARGSLIVLWKGVHVSCRLLLIHCVSMQSATLWVRLHLIQHESFALAETFLGVQYIHVGIKQCPFHICGTAVLQWYYDSTTVSSYP